MSEGVEIWRGSVAAWECDAMGHLNVGFYVAKAMEGLVSLAAELGMPRAFATDAQATLVVREQYIRFMREARPSAALYMTGGVLEIGGTEARLSMILRHHNGDIAASFQIVVAHATAREARPFPWPERVLARAEALKVEIPAGAGPRSIKLEPVEPTASLERANALGLKRLAAGAIRTQDCDAHGRMRPEGMMVRLSDGVPQLFAEGRPGDTPSGGAMGGAAMEYRLIYLAWPRAGDRIELRSGYSAAEGKVRRLTHWLLDPASGEPWGVAEAVVVSLDLKARKIVELTGADLAEAKAKVVDGLTL